ncbi:MAG: hypothetical protein OD918_01275 [Gammaproteobacteria bacterium]
MTVMSFSMSLARSAPSMPLSTSVFDSNTSSTIAPKPQQMMSRKDMLKISPMRRSCFMAMIRPD